MRIATDILTTASIISRALHFRSTCTTWTPSATWITCRILYRAPAHMSIIVHIISLTVTTTGLNKGNFPLITAPYTVYEQLSSRIEWRRNGNYRPNTWLPSLQQYPPVGQQLEGKPWHGEYPEREQFCRRTKSRNILIFRLGWFSWRGGETSLTWRCVTGAKLQSTIAATGSESTKKSTLYTMLETMDMTAWANIYTRITGAWMV